MIQTTEYRQLQPEDRMPMASMKQQGLGARAMARALSRSPSTITRELARNTLTAMPYGSHTAQVASVSRRVAAKPAAKLAFDGVGWGVVRTMLDWKWSPQLIAATLKRVFPDEPERHISHETIYAQPRGEMSRHVDLAAQTGVKVHLCDPHSPWQRGTCENTSGRIRQYLPKGTDLSVFSQDELDAIADSLNTRPRATHNWHTPLGVFAQALASSHKPSTSVH